MNTVISIVTILILMIPGVALAVDDPGISLPSINLNERLLPVNAIKANSEVQIRRVQKLMAENRDQTFWILNQVKFSSKTHNN